MAARAMTGTGLFFVMRSSMPSRTMSAGKRNGRLKHTQYLPTAMM